MKLLIAPHDDDQALFAAYTCLRERPLICVAADSFVQPNRGEKNCDARTRALESTRAGEILGCATVRLGVSDDEITVQKVEAALVRFTGFSTIYAPALQGGNPHHDIVSIAARNLFGKRCVFYTTYTKEQLWTQGPTEIVPTQHEVITKAAALQCFRSQIELPSTYPHFLAVLGKSEFYL